MKYDTPLNNTGPTAGEYLKAMAEIETEEADDVELASYVYPPLVAQAPAAPAPSPGLARLVRAVCARCEEDEVGELFL